LYVDKKVLTLQYASVCGTLAARLMKETLKYITANHRTKIKIGDYISVIIPIGGLFVGGLAMLYNVYKFNHPDLLIPSVTSILISIILMIYAFKKLIIENSYEIIKTDLLKHDNIKLCTEIIINLFDPKEVFGDKNEGLQYFNIESFFSWGKQITLISIDKEILINCRDIRAPFSLFSRNIYLNRIRKAISNKIKPSS
jgi:hypothetical protein